MFAVTYSTSFPKYVRYEVDALVNCSAVSQFISSRSGAARSVGQIALFPYLFIPSA
jgi:hypothetical protein